MLKQYVRDGCSFSAKTVQAYVQDGGNVRLLQVNTRSNGKFFPEKNLGSLHRIL